LDAKHNGDKREEAPNFSRARMDLLDIFFCVHWFETLYGLFVEEFEAMKDIDISSHEKEVYKESLVDKERIMECVAIKMVIVDIHIFVLWIKKVDGEENRKTCKKHNETR